MPIYEVREEKQPSNASCPEARTLQRRSSLHFTVNSAHLWCGEEGEEEQAMRAGNLKWKMVQQKPEIFGREEWVRQKLHLFLLSDAFRSGML